MGRTTMNGTTKWQLKRGEEIPFCRRDTQTPRPPSTPSEWFSRRFPHEAQRWGCPFLELAVEGDVGGFPTKTITPAAMNDNFFAAILNDHQLKHSVVFVEPEQQWFYHEPITNLYHPTTEAKLMLLVSALLVRCAEELGAAKNNRVDVAPLFVKFRTDDQVKMILKKARSLLAADATYFSATSPHRRVEGPEQHSRIARQFIAVAVKQQPDRVLSINECFDTFTNYCRNQDVAPIKRRLFRNMIVEIIREEFGLGLRGDLMGQDGKNRRGWKGLTVEMAGRN